MNTLKDHNAFMIIINRPSFQIIDRVIHSESVNASNCQITLKFFEIMHANFSDL